MTLCDRVGIVAEQIEWRLEHMADPREVRAALAEFRRRLLELLMDGEHRELNRVLDAWQGIERDTSSGVMAPAIEKGAVPDAAADSINISRHEIQ